MTRSRRTANDFFRLRKYAVMLCLMYQLMIISQVSNLVFMVFAGAEADIKGCTNESYNDTNFESLATKYDRCKKYKSMKAADNCSADLEIVFKSVNIEFNTICNGAVVKWSISIQIGGLLLGALVFWHFSEAFGPWKALALVTLCLAVVSLGSSFAVNMNYFTATRFFVMFFVGGQNSVSGTFFMENLPKRHRVWLVTAMSFTPTYLLVTGVAYATKDWRWLTRVIAGFAFSPLFLLCFIHESPSWLLRKGKIAKARKAILGIGEWDRSNKPRKMNALNELIDEELEKQEINDHHRVKKDYGVRSLFSRPSTAGYTVFFSASLMITSVINYGILFNLEYVHGSLYINFLFVSLFRFLIKVSCGALNFFYKSVGRRLLHLVTMSVIIGCLVVASCLSTLATEQYQVMRVALLSACALCSEVYVVDAFSFAEIFAASIRNIGNNVVQCVNKLGCFAAPHIFLLSTVWIPLPYATMSALGMVDVIAFILFIPETKGFFYDFNHRDDLTVSLDRLPGSPMEEDLVRTDSERVPSKREDHIIGEEERRGGSGSGEEGTTSEKKGEQMLRADVEPLSSPTQSTDDDSDDDSGKCRAAILREFSDAEVEFEALADSDEKYAPTGEDVSDEVFLARPRQQSVHSDEDNDDDDDDDEDSEDSEQ